MSDASEQVGATEVSGANTHEESPEQEAFTGLIRTASRLEAELNRVFRPYELTGATYNILKVLQRAGGEGRSCGDIAHQLIAEVPDMTRLLDRLERLGYVIRERSKVDRRMVKVMITDRGVESVHALREPVQECHKRQLGHVAREKLIELIDLLKEVRRDDLAVDNLSNTDETENVTDRKGMGH